MNKSTSQDVEEPKLKLPVGTLFSKVIDTIALLKTPRSSTKLKATLFVKKSRIAGSTNRAAGRRRVPRDTQQNISHSEDSSDFSMTPSLERRETELPALSRSGALQEGSFTDGNELSSSVIQDRRLLDEGLDSKKSPSRMQMLLDSDHGFAKLKKIDRLHRDNSSSSFSSATAKVSSRTSSQFNSPSHGVNSPKRIPETLKTLTTSARLLSKSETSYPKSDLKGESEMHDQLAALRGEEDRNSANTLSGSTDAFMHNSSLHGGGVRSQVLIPLQADRVSVAAGGSSSTRGVRDRGFRQKLPSRNRPGDAKGDRQIVYTERGLSASHQRSARSAKHALSPDFTNSATVTEKDTSSPDKEKERLFEKERGRGGNEIHSVSDRRRFWYKSVLILCTKLFLSRQAARESIKRREAARRLDAALLIIRVCQRFKGRRYAAMQMRILVGHRGAVKKLRLAIVAWRKNRAANILNHFLSVCIKCKAHPHGMSAQYCLRFLRSVRVVQAACRDFLKRIVQQMATLRRDWDAFEVLYISSTVKAMRSETLRVISGSNLSLSSKTGNSNSNSSNNSSSNFSSGYEKTVTTTGSSSSAGYGLSSDRRARSYSNTPALSRNLKNAFNVGVRRTNSTSSAYAYDSDNSHGEMQRSNSGLRLSFSRGMSFDIDIESEVNNGDSGSGNHSSGLTLGSSPHPQPSLPPMTLSAKSKAETKTYVPPLLPPRAYGSSSCLSPSPSPSPSFPYSPSPSPAYPYSPSTSSSSSLCASVPSQATSIASPSCQFSFSPCFHSSSSSAFTSSHFSPASASLIVNSGSKADKRRAYFRNMGVALEYRRATIDMAIKRHGRTFDVSDYVLPPEIKVPYLKLLMLQARRALSYKFKESLRLQFEWTGEVTEYSTADALLLVQSDNQDSLLSVVRYKMDQGGSRPSQQSQSQSQSQSYRGGTETRDAGDTSDPENKQPYRKKRLPFVFYKLNIPEGEIQKSVRAAHEKNNTFQNVERHCT